MSELVNPVVSVVDGAVTTLSTDVAAFFEKPHDAVLKAIVRIKANLPENRLVNFAETVVTRENPSGGAPIKSKAYRLTRDGFTFLAMGFTGERAQAFKWAYIDAFNKMEAVLRQCPVAAVKTITPAQQHQLREAVAKRAKVVSAHYQTIYRSLYARYQVPRYTEILAKDFDDAIEFVRTVDIRVPESRQPTDPEELPGKSTERPLYVSSLVMERLQTFVYYYRYLFREEIDRLINIMRLMGSPHAEMLWDSLHDIHLGLLEDSLAKQGYAVKDLDSYRYWSKRTKACRLA